MYTRQPDELEGIMTDAPARAPAARIVLAPLEDTSTFADRAYTALKDTIVSLNGYEQDGEGRVAQRPAAKGTGAAARAAGWAPASATSRVPRASGRGRAAGRGRSSNARASCARCRGVASTWCAS